MARRNPSRDHSGRRPLVPLGRHGLAGGTAGAKPGQRAARALLVLAVVALGIGVWWWQHGSTFALGQPDPAQNVLLVTIDTLRADALSSYGGPAATPNLDALAAHGARFTFAHAHAVVTLPSHTTILTGHFPYEHGTRDNSGYRVKPGTATLATRLKALGFATGAFIGGFPLTKRFGLTPGFDVYDDQLPEMKSDVSFALPERRADVVVSRALDWIGTRDDRFFAWVHVYDPHSPYTPPAEYLAQYRAQPYYGEVAFVDHALGPLFDRLATLARSTVVFVTADHGESLGEHGEATHGMFAYEATLRIPLIIAQVSGTGDPHRASRPKVKGVVIDAPVRHIDILPTLLDAVGAAPDSSLPGSSLRDLIRTGRGADRPEYFESLTYNLVRGWAPLRGVLVAKTKYIDLPIPELYDLVADPREERNGASQQPDRMQVMANTLSTYNVAPPGRPVQESAETRAALRALLYISGSAPPKETYTAADDPKNLVDLDQEIHTATGLYQNGKPQEATAILNRVLTRRPDTADAAMQLAYVYWESGQIRPAIATLKKALASGAPDRDVRIRLGLYLAESKTDPALAIKLLEGLPDSDVEALNGLGVAYFDAGRYSEARQTFGRLLALDPTNGLAYQNLASIALKEALGTSGALRRSKLQEAETFAKQALEADPSLANAYTTLGAILAELGRSGEAIEDWKRAIELDATEFNALYNLWHELAAAGRRDEAVVYGRQFVRTAPLEFFRRDLDQVRKYLGDGR